MSDSDLEELLAPALSRPVPPMAFSLDDVVRRGHVVRRRRAFAGVATLALVAAVVVLGLTVVRPASERPAAPPLSRAEQQTTARLDDLLSLVPLPQQRNRIGKVAGLPPAQDPPAGPSVHRVEWFQVAMQPAELNKWIAAHGWLGGVWGLGSTTDVTMGSYLLTTSTQVQNVDFPNPIIGISLIHRHGGSAVRVDAWQRPYLAPDRPADTLLTDDVSAVSVTREGRPAVELRGSTQRALTTALNRLPLAVGRNAMECMTTGAVSVVVRDGSRTVTFGYLPDCPSMTVKVDGKVRPDLASYDPRLLAAIQAVTGPWRAS